MKTAIIILNYNSYPDLVKLIDKLLISIDKNKHSIIVIDNFSSKNKEDLENYFLYKNAFFIEGFFATKQKEILCNENLLYIKLNENKGYAYGNNIGLKIAYNLGFEYAFIINPDVVIDNFKIFDDALSIFNSNKKIGIIGYRVVLPNGQNQGPFRYKLGWDVALRNLFFPFYTLIKNLLWYFEKMRKGYVKVPCVVGCFCGLNLNYMHLVDYYDESTFLYYEEQIISDRMIRKGYLSVYRDEYHVLHNHSYEEDLGNNPNFLISRNYYITNYLKPSKTLNLILKISQKYYDLVWKYFFIKTKNLLIKF